MKEQALNELSQQLLGCDYAKLSEIQRSVIDLICAEAPMGVGPQLRDQRTFWERLADQVAAVGGSWRFIGGFGAFLAAWIGLNLLILALGVGKPFDPYPFIFLNLILSMLAAIQAPVIMMSQNRAAARDREQAEHDYTVNLRAELEIMRLHDKLDALRLQELEALIANQTKLIEMVRADLAGVLAGRQLAPDAAP